MATANTNKTQVQGEASTSRLLDSDAPVAVSAQAPSDAPQYLVDGQEVSREEYMKALPRAGYVPERMPENFYPALSTK